MSDPANFVIAPSGPWLYVNNSTADSVVQFAVESGTGELKPTDTTPVPVPLMMASRRQN